MPRMTIRPTTRNPEQQERARQIIRTAAATLGVQPPAIDSEGNLHWPAAQDDVTHALTDAAPDWRHYLNWP